LKDVTHTDEPGGGALSVLVLAGEYPPMVGGVGTFAANSVQALRLAGARVQVATSVPSDSRQREDDVVRILTMLNGKFFKLAALIAGGTYAVLRTRPNITLAAAWPHEGATAHLFWKVLRIPYAVFVHGTDLMAARDVPARRRMMTTILSSARVLVANSTFTKNLIASMGIRTPVAVVNPPIDLARAKATAGLTDVDRRYGLHDKRVLLTTSRLFPRKGHAQVIRALARLRHRYPDLVYVATGDGSFKRTLEELATSCGVSESVRFAGFVDDLDLAALYDRCEVYVSPGVDDGGDIEGFGISFVEASAHGKPVIAGNVGGVADAVSDGETGLLIDGSDVGEVERALDRLLSDGELRTRLGENGRARVRSRFALARQGELLARVLRSAVRFTPDETAGVSLR
jgi:phosphatidylinositol alpha-1,6-mannosyltransferase